MVSEYSPENYCLSEDARFLQRRLGDELLLFDNYSGETHLIGFPGLHVVDLLATETLDKNALCLLLQGIVDASEDEIRPFLEQTIHELMGIGVIKTS